MSNGEGYPYSYYIDRRRFQRLTTEVAVWRRWRRPRAEFRLGGDLQLETPPGAAEILRHMEEEKRHKEQMRELRAIREGIIPAKDQPPAEPEKPEKPAEPVKRRRDTTRTRKPIRNVLNRLYRNGIPANLEPKTILEAVHKDYARRHQRCPDDRTIEAVAEDLRTFTPKN